MLSSPSRCLATVLVLASLAPARTANIRSAPDVAPEVQREMQQNIQIHDIFQSQENQDAQTVSEVRANHDLSQLQLPTGQWVVALDKDLKTKMLVQAQPRDHPSFLSGIK